MRRTILYIILSLIFVDLIYAQPQVGPNKLYPILFNYARDLYPYYGNIAFERKMVLEEIANYIIGARQLDKKARILFIETDHTARAALAQIWAVTAAFYYGIDNIDIYSGGIKPSEISRNVIIALEKAGFIVYKYTDDNNPMYEIKYSYNVPPILIKSIKYDDESNPDTNFGSILLCPNADVNLPVIRGNNFRTSLHYFDPTAYDGSADAIDLYIEKSREIATEMFYMFYILKNAK